MKPSFFLFTHFGLVLIAPIAVAGTWSFTNLTGGNDLESGVDPGKTYTHLIDFGADATAATINGVSFTSKGMTGANYSLAGTGGSFVDNGVGAFAGTGMGDLLTDFYYGGAADGIQTLTLTGLNETQMYRLSFFVSGWGTPAVDIVGSDAPGVTTRLARDGTQWVPDFSNPNTFAPTSAGNPGAIISYDYVAPAGGTLVLTMNALSDADTFHHYGLVNEVVPEPATALLLLAGVGIFTCRRSRVLRS
jgi:hypothetical protein